MSRYVWPRTRRRADLEDDPRGRAAFLGPRRTDFDPEGARVAARQPLRLPGVPGLAAPASGRSKLWQPLGPFTVIHGQATGTPRIAGRVNSLAVHPDGQRIYAASGNGGIWYAGDGGASWRSLGGFAPTNTPEVNRPAQRNTCGTVHVRFGAAEADDDVLVGTGESFSLRAPDAQPGSSLGGVGVLIAHGPAASAAADPWTREAKNLLGASIRRFAVEPGATTTVTATSLGLFQRPGSPSADVDWTKVAGTPFSTLNDDCTDVLWTAGDGGARPARLWVWVATGSNAGLWVRAAGQTNFKQIATPGFSAARAVLAASNPPDQIFVLNDAGGVPMLFRVAAAGAADPVATAVTITANVLQGQGFYDIALAVHPTNANRIVLGGCTFPATTPDGTTLTDGAVVMGDVAPAAGVLTFGAVTPLGVGVHSDVHDVVYSNTGNRLWVSCDGGVFRSDQPTKQVGFYPRNDGLAIIESNYIAGHPTCEGYIACGLQDNGLIERLSNEVWNHTGDGDGGGVVLDPRRPDRLVRQHFQGYWSSNDGTVAATALLTRGANFAQAEFDASAFYSEAASIAHRRAAVAPAPPDVGQIIVGTNRVWYSENFGTSWVTLPTGTDPLPANLAQDGFGEAVTVCRWQSPDVAWILGQGTVKRYARTPGSDAAAGPGTWTVDAIIVKGVKNKKDATAAEGPVRDSDVWTDIAVNLDPPAGAGQPGAVHGTKGAVYLGTIGKADNDDVDTLWWFDGTSKWFGTGLRKDANGVPAPVTAIVCDPDRPEEVYVGTTVGVWRGIRTQAGNADPTWAWESRVNGLPEAAVEDLSIFSDGGIRLLRAAIASRGVWELRLDVDDVQDLTYLRAHDDDLRYRARAVEKKRDLTTARSWHGSPDVRPRRASGPRTAPSTLPWTQTSAIDASALARFQAALRSRTGDPRVRANGVWDSYFNEVLRDLGAPIAASPPASANTVSINAAFWNSNMQAPHSSAEPWGAGTPTEADLRDLAAPLREGDLATASSALPPGRLKVDIVVHQRGLDPVDGANVRVTLLRWIDPATKHAARWDDSTTWPTVNVPWTAAVNEVLNSNDGKTSQAAGAGWSFVLGTASQSHRLALSGQTLDPFHAGIATFDLNLTGFRVNRIVLLVAVIRSGTSPADDIALAPAPLRDLALTSPNVAVRSLRLSP